jgi:formylglycine-generating enzyme required for sulfatase activity
MGRVELVQGRVSVIVSPTPSSALPGEMTAEYQSVDLTAGSRSVAFAVTSGDATATVAFSEQGLQRLKIGIERSGIDAKHFDWPPASDPNRPPYRGLKPLEADDAGIFFGRDAAVIGALDNLRALREAVPPRLLVILGASGAGKSSFLRAGLIPRLARDTRNFHVLPIVRPERAVITGEAGLLRAVEGAFQAATIATTRADLRTAIDGGATALRPLLQQLAEKVTLSTADAVVKPKPATLVIAIDQGEELFLTEGQDEARKFLALLRELLTGHDPAIAALFTIRSDNYERLQLAAELEGVRQVTLSLPPMPKGAYAEVIKGPAKRLDGTPRALKVEDSLVQSLMTDLEAGGAKDSLPLLAFTLERLYGEYHAGGQLKLEHYAELGGIAGSLEAAVKQAFKAANADAKIPRDRHARLALLRRGLIPWVAGIDPDTGAPRRRVARLSEIPAEARPLMNLLVDQRLLSTDVSTDTGEKTVEPAHEALLRQWGLLHGWLREDSGLLGIMHGVKRASRDWAANAKNATWLTHTTDRLKAAERLFERVDLAANLEPTDRDYLAACRDSERLTLRARKRTRTVVGTLAAGLIVGATGWFNQAFLQVQWHWFTIVRPYIVANIRPHVLTESTEQALKPFASFRECAKDCPAMIVIPPGSFMMGSPESEQNRHSSEGPQQKITIAQTFAVSKFPVTFADWDVCVAVGGCQQATKPSLGRDNKPVINVNWHEAKQYVTWLSQMTGRSYLLLTEAQWEYAARAGTATAYPWGSEIGLENANCDSCGSERDKRDKDGTSPVGSFKPTVFGLFDMHGNVGQWVEDCFGSLDMVPPDGAASAETAACRRVVRGGSWRDQPGLVRSASRSSHAPNSRRNHIGIRVGRSLMAKSVETSGSPE